MKTIIHHAVFLIILLTIISGCSPIPNPAPNVQTPSQPITLPPTAPNTPVFHGKTIIVTSPDDGGPGTLRLALSNAQPGDIIKFDPSIFPPEKPAIIQLSSPLPAISQGRITIDASDAGVILDGSQAGGDWSAGIEINSEENTIRGLQIIHFTGPGILLNPSARNNIVGGDRSEGSGPVGQGNAFGDTSDGVAIKGSDNVVIGNLIGIDVVGTGSTGNRGPGVFLEENASRNIIGPDNIIAFNGNAGVEIRSIHAEANIVTMNSIHDNSFQGIYYNTNEDPLVISPPIPAIFDFDLAAGMVSGTACPDCVVEIFSTSHADGEFFEGSVTADQYGNFVFVKSQGLTGPSLTATSLAPDNNTSEFSRPTTGQHRVSVMQSNNPYPKTRYFAKTSGELEDNRIGQLFDKLYLIDGLQSILDNEILRLGTKYVRLTITEAEPTTIMGDEEAQIGWNIPEFSFASEHEDFITALSNNGVSVTYILTFWDKANHPEGWQPNISRFRTQEEIQRYLEYVRFIVSHFKGRVKYYEIWNEPNNKPPLQWIQVNDYIDLVKQTAPVIRQQDPDAKIVVGSIVLQQPEDRDYLFSILNSDVMPLVDVIAWHPMYGVSPENPEYRSYYYDYPVIVKQIKDTAAAHGFQGEFRADEVLYRSPDCYWCYPGDLLNTNITAAKYYARGIILNLGIDLGVGVASNSTVRLETFAVIQNLCTLMAGAKPASVNIEIQSEAKDITFYSFVLPNGDQLIALWKDGVAVEDDPGVKTTMIIPNFSADYTLGIDPLFGFEQQIVTIAEDGNLVVPDFLIKDYPLILRFRNPSTP